MERAIDTLNRLLAAEYGNLARRLSEADPYVTWPAAEDRAAIQRILADVDRHVAGLARRIIDLRGAPVPPTYPTASGGVHYLKLSFLMPQVIADVKDLVRLYESTGTTGDREADALLVRNLEDHRRHLAELQRLHANLHVAAGK